MLLTNFVINIAKFSLEIYKTLNINNGKLNVSIDNTKMKSIFNLYRYLQFIYSMGYVSATSTILKSSIILNDSELRPE